MKKYHSRPLTAGACCDIIFGREFCATAMKQEIAVFDAGNFCGVCPLIGRLEATFRGVYRRDVVLAGFCRSFL